MIYTIILRFSLSLKASACNFNSRRKRLQMRNLLFLLLAVTFLASCDQPRCPKDQVLAVLKSGDSDSSDYQTKLVELLQADKGSVKYYFDGKAEEDGQSLWYINAYGSGYCGRLKLFVDKEDVNVLRLNQTKGYCGAKLSGLRFEVREVDEHLMPFYAGLRSIVD